MPKSKKKYKEVTAEEFALRAECELKKVMKALRTGKLSGRVVRFVEYRVVLDIFRALGYDVDDIRKLIETKSSASPRTLHLIREEDLDAFMESMPLQVYYHDWDRRNE